MINGHTTPLHPLDCTLTDVRPRLVHAEPVTPRREQFPSGSLDRIAIQSPLDRDSPDPFPVEPPHLDEDPLPSAYPVVGFGGDVG